MFNKLFYSSYIISSFQVKFIGDKHKKLIYFEYEDNPKAYSAIVVDYCHLPPNVNKEQWWYSCAKSIVVQKISQLRTAVLKNIWMQWIGKKKFDCTLSLMNGL